LTTLPVAEVIEGEGIVAVRTGAGSNCENGVVSSGDARLSADVARDLIGWFNDRAPVINLAGRGQRSAVKKSLLSVASRGSILSIGSHGSILSIGSSGSILSIGSVGSIASAFSVGSAGSASSLLSAGSLGSVLSAGQRRAVLNRKASRVDMAPIAGALVLTAVGIVFARG
jgi:hypothetical protein